MCWFVNDAVLLLRYLEWVLQGINTDRLRGVWGRKQTPPPPPKKTPTTETRNPRKSWILKSSMRIPMCVLFANCVVCFHSRKPISEKFEASVWGKSRCLFFHFLWACYVIYRLLVVLQYSIAVPPTPINIMQLVHDDAQYADGFYLPKLPNCLFKSVNDK